MKYNSDRYKRGGRRGIKDLPYQVAEFACKPIHDMAWIRLCLVDQPRRVKLSGKRTL